MPSNLTLKLLLVAATIVWALRIAPASWGERPRYVFDEHYTAFTAHLVAEGSPLAGAIAPRRYEYAAREDMTAETRVEWSHPPGAPDAMAMSILLFGWTPFAVRLVSLLSAVATLAATMAMVGRRRAPVAAVLLVTDGLFFVFARVAMPHMLLTALVTAGTAFAIGAARGRRPLAATVAAAALFGFAASVRWSALPIAALVFVALALAPAARLRWRRCALALAVFVAAYAVTFAPMICAGASPAHVALLHRAMLDFHRHVPATGPQSSAWYTWFFQVRPVVLSMAHAPDGTRAVVGRGGLLTLGLLPAIAFGAYRAARFRRPRELAWSAVAVGVLLPWAITSRFGLAYYVLPALPAAAALLAQAAADLPARFRPIVRGALATGALAFVLLYPVLSGLPLQGGAFEHYARVLRLGTKAHEGRVASERAVGSRLDLIGAERDVVDAQVVVKPGDRRERERRAAADAEGARAVQERRVARRGLARRDERAVDVERERALLTNVRKVVQARVVHGVPGAEDADVVGAGGVLIDLDGDDAVAAHAHGEEVAVTEGDAVADHVAERARYGVRRDEVVHHREVDVPELADVVAEVDERVRIVVPDGRVHEDELVVRGAEGRRLAADPQGVRAAGAVDAADAVVRDVRAVSFVERPDVTRRVGGGVLDGRGLRAGGRRDGERGDDGGERRAGGREQRGEHSGSSFFRWVEVAPCRSVCSGHRARAMPARPTAGDARGNHRNPEK
jgi:predicted membrane-bound dolichyl-phosphate-mannose-protein mannosyltransferase